MKKGGFQAIEYDTKEMCPKKCVKKCVQRCMAIEGCLYTLLHPLMDIIIFTEQLIGIGILE